jgi:hypothetical protein
LFTLSLSLFAAFSNLLRRVERLFTKLSKRSSAKRQLDWHAVAGLLTGLGLALDKDESLAKILHFKLLVTSAISLAMSDATASDASTTAVNTSHSFLAQLASPSPAATSFQVRTYFLQAWTTFFQVPRGYCSKGVSASAHN